MDNSNNFNSNNNQTNEGELTSKERNNIIIAAILEVVGIFFAGIPCAVGAIVLVQKIKRKNTSKTIIIVVGILEIFLVIISLFAKML